MTLVTSDNPKVRKGMDLVDEMTREELDSLVDYIRQVYKNKSALDKVRAFATLRVGDRVQYQNNTRPGYLAGLTGTIEEKRQTRVVLKLDCGPIGKFRSGRVVAQPAFLTKIED
jgi:hypothetical protein